MFTGMIEARGEVKSIESVREFVKIRIASSLDLSDVKEGDSITVDGACLTATSIDFSRGELTADVSSETLRVTTLGELKIGSTVNLEKAMRLDSRLGGHMVAGHVDCVGRIIEKRRSGQGWTIGFQVDSGRYLIEKGSVAVDGISLTVNTVEESRFWVMIIPHTAAATGLTEKKINDKVNVEFDLIGKYVEKFVSAKEQGSGISEEKLKEYGFA
ncbi:MAG TPA: riboflavin synthase [Desulfomonilaceae bacterium]|nr:riboflavin synthase [Desulfomonilaceae bacterium]